MNNRDDVLIDFTSQLRDLLSPLYISPNTGIFEQTLCELMDVPFSMDHYPSPKIVRDNGGDYIFSTPQYFSLADINKCLTYIGMDPDAWTSNSGFHISEEMMREKIFPAVQDVVMKMEKSHPERFRDYQIESRPELESAAIAKIEESLAPIAVSLLGQYDNLGEVKKRLDYTVALMRQTFKYMLSCRRTGKQDMLIACIEKFRNLNVVLKAIYHNNPELKNKEKLWQHLSSAIDALDAFNKFNRTDAIIAAKLLFKEMDEFLHHYEITATACDIFEHFMLDAAGISTLPESCKVEICHRDDTRVRFTMTGMSDEDARKLRDWVRMRGDETMHVEGDTHFKGALVFTADGQQFYKNFLPLFREWVKEMQESPGKLKVYQDLSQMQIDTRLCTAAYSQIDDLVDKLQGKMIVNIKGVNITDDMTAKLQKLSYCLCGSIIRQQHGAAIAAAADDFVKYCVNTVEKDSNCDYANEIDSLLEKLHQLSVRFASCTAPMIENLRKSSVITHSVNTSGTLFAIKGKMQDFIARGYNQSHADLTRLTK